MVKRDRLFWTKVDFSGECWNWIAAENGYGYGVFGKRAAHRFAWSLANRCPVPQGMWVLHKCDNPACVRPDHLFLGTPKDNTRDMIAKGRKPIQRGEEVHCAKLTEEQVRAIRAARRGGPKLAKVYGVHHSTIHAIRARKKWAHVD